MEPFNPPRRSEKQGFSSAATTTAERDGGLEMFVDEKGQKSGLKKSKSIHLFDSDSDSDGADAQKYEDLEAEEDNRYRHYNPWYIRLPLIGRTYPDEGEVRMVLTHDLLEDLIEAFVKEHILEAVQETLKPKAKPKRKAATMEEKVAEWVKSKKAKHAKK